MFFYSYRRIYNNLDISPTANGQSETVIGNYRQTPDNSAIREHPLTLNQDSTQFSIPPANPVKTGMRNYDLILLI